MTPDRPAVLMDSKYSGVETARLLGISRETLRRHAESGHIRKRYGRYSPRAHYLGRDILKFWETAF